MNILATDTTHCLTLLPHEVVIHMLSLEFNPSENVAFTYLYISYLIMLWWCILSLSFLDILLNTEILARSLCGMQLRNIAYSGHADKIVRSPVH